MTDYEDLAFEPPLTFEGLKEWAKEHAEVYNELEYGFYLNLGSDVFFILEKHGEETVMYNGYGDYIFGAKHAQVKRVLESMLED